MLKLFKKVGKGLPLRMAPKTPDQVLKEESFARAERAMESACWHESKGWRAEYVSERKLKDIYSSFDRDYPLQSSAGVSAGFSLPGPAGLPASQLNFERNRVYEPSKQKLAKEAVELVSPCMPGDLVGYSGKQDGLYLLIRFPFFSGRLQKRCSSDSFYSNTVFWQGSYHGLTLYACGSISNLVDGPRTEEPLLWDPSGDESAEQLFCGTFDTDCEYCRVSDENIERLFDNLGSALHDGTRRGEREGRHSSWRDMLLRCDYVHHDRTGDIEVFGSPVWTAKITQPCYGWYDLGSIGRFSDDRYFGEWDGRWTGRYCTESGWGDTHTKDARNLIRYIRCDENASLDHRTSVHLCYNVDVVSPEKVPDAIRERKHPPEKLTRLKSCVITDDEWNRMLYQA